MTAFVKNSCPNCGGSLRTWKCDCKPIWSGYTTSDTERASTAPKTIYLDIGDRAALESIEAGGPWETEGVTWSEDNATGDGIRYVRADLASTASAITDEQAHAIAVLCVTASQRQSPLSMAEAESMARHIVTIHPAFHSLAAPTTQPTGQAVEPSQPADTDAMTAAYMAACEGRAPDHNEIGLHYFRAAWTASRTPAPAAPIPLLAKKHTGMRVDYSGLLKQCQQNLKHTGETANAEMLRQLKDHLQELGRRWYSGDTAVVDEILQLYCIEKDARAAIASSTKGTAS